MMATIMVIVLTMFSLTNSLSTLPPMTSAMFRLNTVLAQSVDRGCHHEQLHQLRYGDHDGVDPFHYDARLVLQKAGDHIEDDPDDRVDDGAGEVFFVACRLDIADDLEQTQEQQQCRRHDEADQNDL